MSTQFIEQMLLGWGELKWATSNPDSHFRSRSTLPPHLTPTPPPGVRSSGIPLPPGLLSPLRHGAGGRRWILRAAMSLPPIPSSLPLSEEHGGAVCKGPSSWRAESMLAPASSLGSPFPSCLSALPHSCRALHVGSHPLPAGTWEHSQ